MKDIEQVAMLLVASAVAAMKPDIPHPVVVVFIRDPNDEEEVVISASCLSESTIALIIDSMNEAIPSRCINEERKLKSSEAVVSKLLKDIKRV